MIRNPYVVFRKLGKLSPDGSIEKSLEEMKTEYNIESLYCVIMPGGRFNLKVPGQAEPLPHSLLVHLVVYGSPPDVYVDEDVFDVGTICQGVEDEISFRPRFDIFRNEMSKKRKEGEDLKKATIHAKTFLGPPYKQLKDIA